MSIPRNLSIHADTLNSDGNFTSITDTGNLTFTGTGNRITGDFSNATVANRVLFQTSTANGNTLVRAIPNGTAIQANIAVANSSDAANCGIMQIVATSTEAQLASGINGTGTYLPMAFQTGGSERMRLDTSGNLLLGTSSGSARLVVNGGTSTSQIRWEVNNAAFTQEVSTNAAANAYVYKTNDASYHVWKLSSSTAMTLDASGNLGISTSSPSQRLQVGDGTADTRASFRPNNAFAVGIANGAGFAGWIGGSGTTDVMVFSNSGGSERMRITSAGDFGIGTSSPAGRIEASSSSQNIVVSRSTGSYAAFQRIAPAGQRVYDFYTINGVEVARITGDPSYIGFATGSSALERMRIDSNGNVQIGNSAVATNTLRFFDVYNTDTGASAGAIIRLVTSNAAASGNTTVDLVKYKAGGFILNNNDTNAAVFTAFGVGASERMRIDSSGNLLVGQTAVGTQDLNSYSFNVSTGAIAQNHITGTGSGASYTVYAYAGTVIGSVTQSGTTAVLFNVTSDQRLKENIQDAESASALIDALQVRQFDWKTDNTHQRYGFIAQELVTVAPEAVHQPADPEEMMAVDYSKLVPMLVKEIQSLRKRLADAGIA